MASSLGIESYAVPRAEQHDFIGTDYYYGGSVRMDIGGLHPAKLHAEMMRLALAAGATVHGETAVAGISAKGTGFEIRTARGSTTAAHVIAGPNGYADESDKWLRRRLVPVRSRIVATAPLSPNLMGALMPRRMMMSDSRKSHYLLPPLAGRHAHSVRRPRRHDRRRPGVAHRHAGVRDARTIPGIAGYGDHP